MVYANNTTNSTTDEPCLGEILLPDSFFRNISIAAGIIIMLLMLTQKRLSFHTQYCNSRPGLLVPMNVLEGRRDRWLYVAAYGLTVNIILSLVSKSDMPVVVNEERTYATLNLLISIGVYVVCCYPIFACIMLNNTLGYLTGSVYIWAFTVLQMLTTIDCDLNVNGEEYVYGILFPFLPLMFFMAALSIAFPVRFIQCFLRHRFTKSLQDQPQSRVNTYQRNYVKEIFQEAKALRKQKYKMEENDIISKIDRAKSTVLRRSKGFRYSPRILSSVTVASVLIYVILYFCILFWTWTRDGFDALFAWLLADDSFSDADKYSILYVADIVVDLLPIFNTGDRNSTDSTLLQWQDLQEIASLLEKHVNVAVYIFLACTILATIFSIFHVAHFMKCHKDHLKQMQTGKFAGIESMSNASMVAASLRFSGYQAAYLMWGFGFQLVLLFIIIFIVTEIFVLPIVWDYADLWLWNLLIFFGIPLVVSFGINMAQLLMGRFVFLQRPDWLSLDNRRLYFIMVYVFYFYNVVVGLFSCLFRILKQIILGVWFLSRLDYSTLSRLFERFDPGFTSYVGFLHVENAHTNPMVITFVSIMLDVINTDEKYLLSSAGDSVKYNQIQSFDNATLSTNETSDARNVSNSKQHLSKMNDEEHGAERGQVNVAVIDGNQSRPSDRSQPVMFKLRTLSATEPPKMSATKKKLVARNRWLVAYTLINNPILKFKRVTNTNYLDMIYQQEKLKAKKFSVNTLLADTVSGAIGLGALGHSD